MTCVVRKLGSRGGVVFVDESAALRPGCVGLGCRVLAEVRRAGHSWTRLTTYPPTCAKSVDWFCEFKVRLRVKDPG